MPTHRPFIGLAALLLIVSTSNAQQTDDVIAPLVNENTLLVARGELGRIDLDSCLNWLVDRGGIADPAAREMLKRAWKGAFEQWGGLLGDARAAGVSRAYWVLNLQDLMRRQGTWAFAIEGKADAQKLIDALRRRKLEARQVGNLVIATEDGRMPTPGPAGTLPHAWAQALGAAGADAPIRIAFVPTTVLRKSLEENMPSLPLEAGQAPITTLTRGIDWMGLSVVLPPNPSMKMVAQCPDANAAKAVGNLVNHALADLRQYREQAQPGFPAPAELADMLKPTVVADQVRWEPEFQKAIILPVIQRDLRQAVRRESAGNMKQILEGIYMYAKNHKGQTPPDLDVLIKDQDMSPQVLIDPLNPTEKSGFVYVRPTGDWQNNGGDLLVLYESTPNGQNIGYADGHVEWWPTHQQVLDQVKAAEARNGAANEKK